MANLNHYNPLIDLTSNPAVHWTVSTVATDRIVYESGGQHLIVQGNFTIGPAGEASAGTVTGILLNVGALNMPALALANLSVDAKAFVQLVASATTQQQVFSFLLNGNDTITAGPTDDQVQGFAGNDTISTGAGNDWIAEGAGNDTIDGGAGFDVVAYNGKFADYVVERTSGGFKVTNPVFSTDGSRPSDVDQLVNVERLYFSDKHVALINADSTGGQVFRMYQAAFGRAPDEAGLDFWSLQMDTKGIKLNSIANGFIVSDEYRQLYGTSTSNHDLVAKYYEHILHRAADEGGLAFWSGVLDNHKATQAEVLAAISESAESVALSVTLIGNGVVMDPTIMTH
jgi:hypothetical protein